MIVQACQTERKIDNIIVRENSSYEYDLSKGDGFVRNTYGGIYRKFKFHKIPEAKIQQISELYHEKKLDTIPNGKFIFDKGRNNGPPRTATIQVLFNDNSKPKEIRFFDNGDPNPAERMPDYTRDFYKEVTDITNTIRDSLKLISPVVYR